MGNFKSLINWLLHAPTSRALYLSTFQMWAHQIFWQQDNPQLLLLWFFQPLELPKWLMKPVFTDLGGQDNFSHLQKSAIDLCQSHRLPWHIAPIIVSPTIQILTPAPRQMISHHVHSRPATSALPPTWHPLHNPPPIPECVQSSQPPTAPLSAVLNSTQKKAKQTKKRGLT